jgi:hypothetical protein
MKRADLETGTAQGASAKQIAGAILCFLAGLVALWLSLTIEGLVGLGHAHTELLASPSVRISIASGLALVFCVLAIPLIVPWFVAFLPAYLFIPRKSIFWKWWVCTLSGVVARILALWIDALVYSLLTYGRLFSINVPLLKSASIPAAVLGGTICFTAAIGARFFNAASYPDADFATSH